MVQLPGKGGFSSAAQAARHVIIVGGGASGVLLAAHLLRNEGNTRVTIVERRALLGCGVAYSTADPGHLLNTRVSNMSAWPDQPEHFLNWVRVTHDPDVCPFSFVRRGLYGEYMAGLLDPWRNSDMLNCARQDCLRIEESDGGGVIAHLADGTRLVGDIAVLATGHLLPDTTSTQALTQPWAAAADGTPEDRVLIVGSGLTMIDQVVSLRAQGHRGAISVLSRRGLLPQVHEPTTPVRFTQDTLPLGAGAAATMHWIRAAVRAQFAAGGNWRDVVDGLRPHVQSLWRAMPQRARATFLRHACVWWEVHRHRMPPQSWQILQDAISDGQLTFLRGAFLDVTSGTDRRKYPRVRLKGQSALQVMVVERIIDCRGIRRDPALHAGPVVGNLLSSGRARICHYRMPLLNAVLRHVAWDQETPGPRPSLLDQAASQTWFRIRAAISDLSCGRKRP